MHSERVKSSHSPDIAIVWPLPQADALLHSTSHTTGCLSTSKSPGSDRRPSPSAGRNRASSSQSTRQSPCRSSPSRHPLYQHLQPSPAKSRPEELSLSQNSVFQKIASEIPSPSANQAALPGATHMWDQVYYHSETPSQIVPTQPITFEAAFSQQMKEPRGRAPSSSSTKRLERIVLGDFSVLSGMGAVMPMEQAVEDSQPNGAGDTGQEDLKGDDRLDRPISPTPEHVLPPSRVILAARHLNSPTRPAPASAASGLPTPPLTDGRPLKPFRLEHDNDDVIGEDEDELEKEIQDLRRCTSKYGILSPPSSSTAGRDQGKDFVDPFSAEYDEMEVEGDSMDDAEERHTGVQAGVPVTHAKSKQARLGALARLKQQRNRLDIPPVTPVMPGKGRKTTKAVPIRLAAPLEDDDDGATQSDESDLAQRRATVRPKKRRRIAGSSQTEGPEETEGLRVEGGAMEWNVQDDDSGHKGSSWHGQSGPNNVADQAFDAGASDPEARVGRPARTGRMNSASGLLDQDHSGYNKADTNSDQHNDQLCDVGESSSAENELHDSSSANLARMFDDTEDDDDNRSNGERADSPEVNLKVKSEKSLGKRPQEGLPFQSNDHQASTGNDFIDLTEEDMGDEYELDKYELTQVPTADEEDLDPDLDGMDGFDAFDWDPSQPVREDSPGPDTSKPPEALGVLADEEELIHPIRTISSLPEKLKQFYLTHWCRTTTRKPDELVGPAAQLANDRIVQAEVAAAVDKRMRGKTWDNTAPNRAGKSTRGGRGGARGGRGAARGKAFFIQRAMRARRGRGR